jgi:hypothetical protein
LISSADAVSKKQLDDLEKIIAGFFSCQIIPAYYPFVSLPVIRGSFTLLMLYRMSAESGTLSEILPSG